MLNKTPQLKDPSTRLPIRQKTSGRKQRKNGLTCSG